MYVDLQGTLQLGPGKHCDADDGPLTGPVYPIALLDKNKGPTAQAGLFEQTIDSEGSFEALPFPGNLLATVTYFAPLKPSLFVLRFTFADDTTVDVVTQGMSLLEHDPDNAVTGIAAKGSGKVRWLATGTLA